jgi:DNA-binding NarL/FixJ family response regulator
VPPIFSAVSSLFHAHESARAVRTRVEHLYEKVGASERAQLVAVAMRRGLLE